MKKEVLFINGFIMKLIAFFLMTLDHVGIYLMYSSDEKVFMTGQIFRLFGRLAFPLFVLMLAEGVRHTHSFPKYALRLGIVASIIMLAQVIGYFFIDNTLGEMYSPLLDLLCYGTLLYFLSKKNRWSWLAIIPLGIVVLSYVVTLIESTQNINILWFPIFLRSGYSIFGLIIALIMYFSYPLLKKFFESYHMDVENYEESGTFRFSLNMCYSIAIVVAVCVIYLVAKIPNCDLFMVNEPVFSETWALASIIFVLFYSGTRGYNAKWFQYASYLYFPLHLVIIYFIFMIIGV